jgi:DNA-binding NtrC family response regulator
VVVAQLTKENSSLRAVLGQVPESSEFVCESEEMRRLMHRLQRVAPLQAAVLLTGESGTGKTMFASYIHKLGHRRDAPFVSLSCANLPRELLESELFGHEKGAFTGAQSARAGLAELADGGTLFLDEIGELPMETQPKLLTFLQDRMVRRVGGKSSRAVDVRIICATNQDLLALVRHGRFREDLYFRVNVLHLDIPPLRARRADIRQLALRIVGSLRAKFGGAVPVSLSDDVLSALERHSWPGNVRELEHVIERAIAYSESGHITAESLELSGSDRPGSPSSSLAGLSMAAVEERHLRETFEYCEGDKVKMAKVLGVSLKTVYNKLKKLGVS